MSDEFQYSIKKSINKDSQVKKCQNLIKSKFTKSKTSLSFVDQTSQPTLLKSNLASKHKSPQSIQAYIKDPWWSSSPRSKKVNSPSQERVSISNKLASIHSMSTKATNQKPKKAKKPTRRVSWPQKSDKPPARHTRQMVSEYLLSLTQESSNAPTTHPGRCDSDHCRLVSKRFCFQCMLSPDYHSDQRWRCPTSPRIARKKNQPSHSWLHQNDYHSKAKHRVSQIAVQPIIQIRTRRGDQTPNGS